MLNCGIGYSQLIAETVAINSLEITEDHSELSFLDSIIAHKRLVGLGECTHGTQEFNYMNLKMFSYLVERHGFRTLFLEDEYTRCLLVDNYIKHSKTKNKSIISELGKWPWQTEEMFNLIEWMRVYNADHKNDQLSFVGIDMQDTEHMYQSINTIFKNVELDTIPLNKSESIKQENESLDFELSLHKEEWFIKIENQKKHLSDSEKQKVDLIVEHLNQNKVMLETPENIFYRDICMGNNLIERINESNSKAMVIAHAIHLYKYSNKRKNKLKQSARAGGVIEQAFGNEFMVIAQDFDVGCFNAWHLKDRKSIDKSLSNPSFDDYTLGAVCLDLSEEESLGEGLQDVPQEIIYFDTQIFSKKNKAIYRNNRKYMRMHAEGALFRDSGDNKSHSYYFSPRVIDAFFFYKLSNPTHLIRD